MMLPDMTNNFQMGYIMADLISLIIQRRISKLSIGDFLYNINKYLNGDFLYK